MREGEREREMKVCMYVYRGGIVQSKLFERSRARAITPAAITTPVHEEGGSVERRCVQRGGGGGNRVGSDEETRGI